MSITRPAPLSLLALALAGTPAAAQSGFEGVIVSRMYQGGKPIETSTSYKGQTSRMEITSGKNARQGYHLFDGAAGVSYAVMPEQKMYMKLDYKGLGEDLEKEKTEAADASGTEITETDRVETIAGHECRHYLIESDGEQLDICAAKGLGFMGVFGQMPGAKNPVGPSVPVQHRKLYAAYKDGFQPLKMERVKGNKRELMMEVVSIEKKSLEQGLFELPEGYKEFNMGGMMKDAMRGRIPRPNRPPG